MCLSCCQITMVSFVTRWLETLLLDESIRMLLKEVRILMTRLWDTEHSNPPMRAVRIHSTGNQKGTSLSLSYARNLWHWFSCLWSWQGSHISESAIVFWDFGLILNETIAFFILQLSGSTPEDFLISVVMPVHPIINTIMGLCVSLQLFLWRILNDTLTVVSVFCFLWVLELTTRV